MSEQALFAKRRGKGQTACTVGSWGPRSPGRPRCDVQVGYAKARIEEWLLLLVADGGCRLPTTSMKEHFGRSDRREKNSTRPQKGPTPSNPAPPTCFGRTFVAQPTGTCRHRQDLTFLTACLEPACTWGLTFRVAPFVTWSAFL